MESIGRSTNLEYNSKYLDVNKLVEGIVFHGVAYVHDVSLGMSKFESGFVKFFLKDCNANVITATLFDVEDFMMSGISVAALRHKAIEFKGATQEYRGRKSIVIDGREPVKVYDGEFDYARFIGTVKSDLSDFERTCVDADITIDNVNWEKTSFDELCRGKCGAYSRFIELSFGTCKPMLNAFTDEERKEFLSTFVITAENYFKYLKKHQNIEVIGSLGVYELLSCISSKYADDNAKMIYLDTLSAVVGADKPKHLYAHLIKEAFDTARFTLTLQSQYETMPIGTKMHVGGVDLSKY